MSLLARLFRSAARPARGLAAAVAPGGRVSRDAAMVYRDDGVADTVAGRFDMIAAVLALVLLRLERDEPCGRETALLTELFVATWTAQLRETGVGDIVVGKHIGKLVAVLGGRLGAYREALASEGDGAARGGAGAQRHDARRRATRRRWRERLRPLRRQARRQLDSEVLAGRDRADERARILAPGRPSGRSTPKPITLEANAEERKALARRFGLVAIERLRGRSRARSRRRGGDGARPAVGRDRAELRGLGRGPAGEDRRAARACASCPNAPVTEEEIELAENELDEIPFGAHAFDLGEAVAQSLALAIDPYATGPEAERVRKEEGLSDEAAERARSPRWRRSEG